MKYNKTFYDDKLQAKFEKYGYVILENFLSIDEVEYLKTIYNKTKNVVEDKEFFISQWSDKMDLKFEINDAIQSVFVKKADQFLNNYTPVFGVFAVKHPGKNSAMYLHADWSHVDESKYRTVNVWSPLLDVSNHNGSVCLIKGSNRFFDAIRGASIPDAFESIEKAKLEPYLTDVEINAGDVIMWDHSIVHGSRVNQSKETRVAGVLNMRPKDSTFYLYYADKPNNPDFIEVFEPSPNFFLENDSANNAALVKENSTFIKKIKYNKLKKTEKELKSFLLNEFPNEFPQIKKDSLYSKIINFFKN